MQSGAWARDFGRTGSAPHTLFARILAPAPCKVAPVKLLAKLRHGVVEICAGDECRYAEPTLLQRAYLLWTLRNFRRLSVRVLNPRQRQIIERLSDFAHRADAKGMNSALVIGRAELGAFPLHRPPRPWLLPRSDEPRATPDTR